MNKEDVIYTNNGILLSLEKKVNLPFVTIWVDIEGIMLSEMSQRKTNTGWYQLYMERLKTVKLTETENRKVVARVWVVRETRRDW